MKNIVGVLTVMAIVGVPAMYGRTAASQATSSVRVHVVTTNTSVLEDQDPPSLQVKQVTVTQGKTPPEVISSYQQEEKMRLSRMTLTARRRGYRSETT